jgi:hypothetical protein
MTDLPSEIEVVDPEVVTPKTKKMRKFKITEDKEQLSSINVMPGEEILESKGTLIEEYESFYVLEVTIKYHNIDSVEMKQNLLVGKDMVTEIIEEALN